MTNGPPALPGRAAFGRSGGPLGAPAAIYAGLSLAWAVVFLTRLNSFPLQAGDEARLAVNAIEMVMNGDWLVTHYDGLPEANNLKPPLLIWLMALLLKLTADPIWAIRLPSALASLGTVLIVARFCSVELRDPAAGFFAGLVLLTSWGFTSLHTGATGDYDALLTLWITAYALAWSRFVDAETGGRRADLAVFAVALFLAIMTKGIAGVMPVPGLLLYVAITGRLKRVLGDRSLWFAAGLVLVAGLGYFLLRELASPGYLGNMVRGDIAGSATGTGWRYRPPWTYYLQFVGNLLLSVWFLPLPLLAWLVLAGGDARQRKAFWLAVCMAGWVFAVINAMVTKFFWYFLPIMPFMALVAGMGLSRVRALLPGGQPFMRDAAIIAVMAYFVVLHRQQDIVPDGFRYPPPHDRQLLYGGFLPALRPIEPGRALLLADSGIENWPNFPHFNPVALFYAHVEAWRGRPTSILPQGGRPPIGALVASCDDVSLHWLEAAFTLRPLAGDPDCRAVEVTGTAGGTTEGAP